MHVPSHLTCAPSPWYKQFTTLSKRLISSFWLKSSSWRAAWSANIVIIAGIDYCKINFKNIDQLVRNYYQMQLQSKCFNLAHLSHWNNMLMLAVTDNIALTVGHIPGQTFLSPHEKFTHHYPSSTLRQGLQQVKHIIRVWLENGLCYQHPGAYFTAGTKPYMFAGGKALYHYNPKPHWQSQPSIKFPRPTCTFRRFSSKSF